MMVVLEVGGELLATIEDFGALVDAAGGERHLAPPGFDLVVLSVFVAFPVVFGAKSLVAGSVGAAVGASVALFVFSGILPSAWVEGSDGEGDIPEVAVSDHGFGALITCNATFGVRHLG